MENLTSENRKSNEENPLRRWIIILGALAFIFFCTTVYFAFFAAPSSLFIHVILAVTLGVSTGLFLLFIFLHLSIQECALR